jgi:hypothetical protein
MCVSHACACHYTVHLTPILMKAQMGTSEKMGQFLVQSFRTDFPQDLLPEFPGTVLSSRAFPHCLRTSRNSENVMKAIDSAFVQWRWRAAAATLDYNYPCSEHARCTDDSCIDKSCTDKSCTDKSCTDKGRDMTHVCHKGAQ